METCRPLAIASGSRFVRRAEQEEGEERGGGDGSETEGAGLAGRPPWFPGLVGRAPSSSSSRVTASHGVVVSLLPASVSLQFLGLELPLCSRIIFLCSFSFFFSSRDLCAVVWSLDCAVSV